MAKGTTGKHKKKTGTVKNLSKHQNVERRQGRRFFFLWVPIIIIVLLFFYAFVFDPPRSVGEPIPGTVQEDGQERSSGVTEKIYSVVLDDGRIVKLDGFQMSSKESGKRLLVQENVSLLFKRKSFSFVKYIK
ncbi:MAG: hypothetical protein WBJ54_13320 [Syntrophorhabdus sp.]|jgi:hypothetical protein|nr:hypothetical protein [Syntrophorhabdus sp.]HNY70723.1 hypothetical protein [Syntrophorhabdus sp.]HOH27873.1 hypothetical protein [Syntrophorhabdus sp.]